MSLIQYPTDCPDSGSILQTIHFLTSFCSKNVNWKVCIWTRGRKRTWFYFFEFWTENCSLRVSEFSGKFQPKFSLESQDNFCPKSIFEGYFWQKCLKCVKNSFRLYALKTKLYAIGKCKTYAHKFVFELTKCWSILCTFSKMC